MQARSMICECKLAICNYLILILCVRFNSKHNSDVKSYLIQSLEDNYSPETYTPKKINSKSQPVQLHTSMTCSTKSLFSLVRTCVRVCVCIMCVCACMNTHICMSVCALHACVYMGVYMDVHVHVCMCLCIHVHVFVCVYVHACVHVCMHVY